MLTYCRRSSGPPAGAAAPPRRGTVSGSAAWFHRRVCVKPGKVSPAAPPAAVPPSPASVSMSSGANGYSGPPQVWFPRYFRPPGRYRSDVRCPPRGAGDLGCRAGLLHAAQNYHHPRFTSSPLRTAGLCLVFFCSTPRLCRALSRPDWIPPTLRRNAARLCRFRRGSSCV